MRRFVPARRTLAIAAFAPVSSLITSRLLTMAIGATGFGDTLPHGVHTFAPVVNLIGIDRLSVLSLLPAMLGIGLLLRSPRSGHGPVRSALEFGAILVAAQLLFYALQAALVAQVQGLPDSGSMVALAMVLQAGAVIAGMAATGTGALLFTPPGRNQPGPAWFIATGARLEASPLFAPACHLPGAPRRGPPLSLSSI